MKLKIKKNTFMRLGPFRYFSLSPLESLQYLPAPIVAIRTSSGPTWRRYGGTDRTLWRNVTVENTDGKTDRQQPTWST